MLETFWAWLATLSQGSASFVGTLTGSSLGLAAILAGALFNARLNRKRDDRQREEERIALASTLYAELAGIQRTLTENAKRLSDKPPDSAGGFMVPEPTIKILPEVLSKIGLLKSDTIRSVMDAYILTEQYLDRLILLGGKLQPNMPENRQLVYLDAKHAKHVIQFNQLVADEIKKAMDTLVPHLK